MMFLSDGAVYTGFCLCQYFSYTKWFLWSQYFRNCKITVKPTSVFECWSGLMIFVLKRGTAFLNGSHTHMVIDDGEGSEYTNK